jgi:hypothetical protein
MAVTPLEKYRESALLGGVWKRTELSPRDRGIVTLAALISRKRFCQRRWRKASTTRLKAAEDCRRLG